MECIKNCCKRLAEKRWKAPEETQGVAVQIPVGGAGAPNRWGVDEDYLLSRMPADGKEVPFVLPTLKASYVQPGASTYVDPQYGMPGGGERLSRSMFELDSSYGASLKSFDSTSSVLSTPASVTDSIKSSTESFPQSGDDLGRLCVRLSYREELEQVWITLVQCSELNLPVNPAQKPKIRIKGVITLPKPVHFKTSVQEYSQDATFMETFVFALSLQSLRRGALRLSLQTRGARKRTAAQCVLSLRQLGPRETERWLRLGSPGKSSAGGCELHLATCFQPVSRRLQVRVLAAQNLPAGSSPLPPAYAAHVEMRAPERPPDKRKTRALKAHAGRCQWDATFYLELDALHPAACALAVKLFSCGSVNRKQCVGQVQLGSDAPTQEAAEQWKETVEYPEKVVAAWHAVT
ncbi:tandem C2 domains nuclear protein isoform X2 [Syngnathoides biaculeatus]|uniref:tandem C2 domains nuclear protein isoform X2 n=1 Tax=Syngnathoides biaculeatus TaxID=300417 RepID=UPI002ADD3683|nr:tandem C2 domains nuclear protein isoform X2 [Syngnathoides biaculeatus]